MKYIPHVRRKNQRLKNFDYSLNGYYFVTICTQNRNNYFGDFTKNQMNVNGAGRMVESIWNEIPIFYAGVDVDQFIVMPNHCHGIIILNNVGATPCGCPDTQLGQARGPAPTNNRFSLSDIVHRFKSLTTARYRYGVRHNGWHPFQGRLWQRNYYDRIIRNDSELNRIRKYIIENPINWSFDKENLN